MNDAEQIAQMRRQAQRLQDDGAHNAAQSLRDGADRLEALTQDQGAPHADAGPQDDAYVPLPDGGKIAVRQYGDRPRQGVNLANGGPIRGPGYTS